MIHQPTFDQTRRANRKRTYSGPGFGPRSFECLGMGMGLGIGLAAGASGPTFAQILAGVPLVWQFDVSAAGTGTSPTGNGNTLASGTLISSLKDQAGSRNFATTGGNQAYSAAGGPNANATAQSAGQYWSTAYASPAPGTTPSCLIMFVRPDVWALNGAIVSAGGALQIAGSSAGKYTARNGVASAEVAAAAGTWIRIAARFGNTTTDFLRMGANVTTGTALGNATGSGTCYIGVDAAYSAQTIAAGFMTAGNLTDAQFTLFDAFFASRFSGVQF